MLEGLARCAIPDRLTSKKKNSAACVSFTGLNQKTVMLFLGYYVNICWVDIIHLKSDPGMAKHILKWGQNLLCLYLKRLPPWLVAEKVLVIIL